MQKKEPKESYHMIHGTADVTELGESVLASVVELAKQLLLANCMSVYTNLIWFPVFFFAVLHNVAIG